MAFAAFYVGTVGGAGLPHVPHPYGIHGEDGNHPMDQAYVFLLLVSLPHALAINPPLRRDPPSPAYGRA